MSVKQIVIVLNTSDECIDEVLLKVRNFRLDLEMSGLDVAFDHTVKDVRDGEESDVP